MIVCMQCDRQIVSGGCCDRCFGTSSDPAVWPSVRTYSVTGIGIAAVVAIAVSVLFNLITAWSPLLGAQSAQAGDPARGYGIILIASLVDGLTQLVVAVVVIIWLWRARKNLDAFPNGGAVLGAGWAIGAWFVPLANVILSGRLVHGVARYTLHRRWAGVVAILWCVTFWAASFMGRLVPDAPADASDVGHALHMRSILLPANLLQLALQVIAGGCLVAIIIAVSRTQDSRIARGQASQWLAAQTPVPAPAG